MTRWPSLFLRGAICAFVAGAAVAVGPGPTAAFERSRCQCAVRLADLGETFPQLAARIADGLPLTIVAIGSSSTEGTPSIRKSAVYPSVLESVLSARLPVPVRVLNRGRGGESIPETVARFDRDVFAHAPDLLVWQLGVNDVLGQSSIVERAALIERTIQRVSAAGIPLVLMDLQYAPAVTGAADTPAMMAALKVASLPKNVALFTRFGVMRRMVESGEASLFDLIERDGLHMTTLAHGCTGLLLAESIVRATTLRTSALSQ